MVPVLGNNVGITLRNHDISWKDFISCTAGLSRNVTGTFFGYNLCRLFVVVELTFTVIII